MGGCGDCWDCGLIEKIKNFFCTDSCCVGYHSGPSDTELHAKRIADELAQMKTNKQIIWQKNEKMLLDQIGEEMTSLLSQLHQINQKKFGEKALNIDLDGINVRTDELKKKVIGYVGRVFEDRLVLTDKELSLIMEERDDDKRSKNFDAFCKKLQIQAISGLKKQIQASITAQNQIIIDTITNRLEEVDASIRHETEAYQALLKAKQEKDAKAPIQMQHMYLHGLCEILLSLADD